MVDEIQFMLIGSRHFFMSVSFHLFCSNIEAMKEVIENLHVVLRNNHIDRCAMSERLVQSKLLCFCLSFFICCSLPYYFCQSSSLHLSIYLSIRPPMHPSIYPSVRPSVCLSVYLFYSILFCSVLFHFVLSFICLSISLSVYVH